jgi:hypothetical protein
MTDDTTDPKIDPAVVKLALEYERDIFIDNGHAVQCSSTCNKAAGEVAVWAVHTKREWTPKLYASITAKYAWLEINRPGYDYKQRLYYAGEEFGRSPGTVKTALKVIQRKPETT